MNQKFFMHGLQCKQMYIIAYSGCPGWSFDNQTRSILLTRFLHMYINRHVKYENIQ